MPTALLGVRHRLLWPLYSFLHQPWCTFSTPFLVSLPVWMVSAVPPYLSQTPLVHGGWGEQAGVQSVGGGPVEIVDCLQPDRARLKAILLKRSGPVVMRQVAVERKVDQRPEMLGFVRNRGRPSLILFRSPLCFDGTYDGGVVGIERSETAGKSSGLESQRLGLKEGDRACGVGFKILAYLGNGGLVGVGGVVDVWSPWSRPSGIWAHVYYLGLSSSGLTKDKTFGLPNFRFRIWDPGGFTIKIWDPRLFLVRYQFFSWDQYLQGTVGIIDQKLSSSILMDDAEKFIVSILLVYPPPPRVSLNR